MNGLTIEPYYLLQTDEEEEEKEGRALKRCPNHVIFLDIKLKHLGDLLDIKESMSSSDPSCKSKPDELAHYYVDGVLSGLF